MCNAKQTADIFNGGTERRKKTLPGSNKVETKKSQKHGKINRKQVENDDSKLQL